nr:hypothetical protein [Angustibacter aerolatus]
MRLAEQPARAGARPVERPAAPLRAAAQPRPRRRAGARGAEHRPGAARCRRPGGAGPRRRRRRRRRRCCRRRPAAAAGAGCVRPGAAGPARAARGREGRPRPAPAGARRAWCATACWCAATASSSGCCGWGAGCRLPPTRTRLPSRSSGCGPR